MNLSAISNLKQLSNFLRCDDVFLKAYLGGDFEIIDYQTFALPISNPYTTIIEKLYIRKKSKHSKSFREVYSIRTDTLKDILKRLSAFLREAHTPSTAVHGYVNGKNIRTNAAMHLSKRHLLSVDISDFFSSITKDMVFNALLEIGFSHYAADCLSKVVTIDNFLPQGYSTSPILSNIVARKLDEELLNQCTKDCIYTRYADDLYFSSNSLIPTIDNIRIIVAKYGFTLNDKKTKFMPRGVKQYVTGLTVFDSIRPRITKKIKRNLRLELHYLSIHGLRGHVLHKLHKTSADYAENDKIKLEVDLAVKEIDQRITGWLNFINSIETDLAGRLRHKYHQVNM